MKYLHVLSLLCLGLTLASTSCSKDDDDEEQTPSQNVTPTQDSTTVIDNKTYKYYGAELYSKESFTYGKFEARMKMAYAPGCISSMFLYYNDSYMGNGKVWNEIDIEVIGKSSTGFQSNLITGSKESQVTSEKIHNLGYAVNSDYHVYTVEWTPDYISWSVDGVETRRTAATTDTKQQVANMVQAQSLRFNLWASDVTAWVGTFDKTKIPVAQYIDYVKVYDYDTASQTFSERWTDDFDTFDSTRWSKGNWTMGLVTEKTDNVVVEDGNLVLKLTKE